MSKILISGSLAYDHIMVFPDQFRNHFLPDKLHAINVSFNVSEHKEHFGGTAGNIGYTLALLGEAPTIIATAGNDFGRYAEHLQKAGVDISAIHVTNDLPCSFAYVVTDSGNNQIAAFYPGAGGVAYGAGMPLEDAKLAIIAPGCLDDVRVFPEIYRAKSIPFFFDPGQIIPALTSEELKNGITGAEAVFCNDYELALISKKTSWKESDILTHTKTLIVTLGEAGSRVMTRDGEVRVSAAHTDDVRDPTGAGDAYRAGYAKAFLAGLAPEACAKIASATAVYAIESVGTQEHHFTMDAFKTRYEKAYGEALPLA